MTASSDVIINRTNLYLHQQVIDEIITIYHDQQYISNLACSSLFSSKLIKTVALERTKMNNRNGLYSQLVNNINIRKQYT